MSENQIVIIGAGPAGLMAAQTLAEKGFKVHVYEQNKAAARKFLVAGNGGFNLTHSEEIDNFIQKYDSPEIQKIVKNFDNLGFQISELQRMLGAQVKFFLPKTLSLFRF